MWGGINRGRGSGPEELRYNYRNRSLQYTWLFTSCVHDVDTRSSLVEEAVSTSRVSLASEMAANMLDNYQQSELCRENDRKLQKTMEALLEREQGGRERAVISATYATNFLWQVRACRNHGLSGFNQYILLFVSDVCCVHQISCHYCEKSSQLSLSGWLVLSCFPHTIFLLNATSLLVYFSALTLFYQHDLLQWSEHQSLVYKPFNSLICSCWTTRLF